MNDHQLGRYLSEIVRQAEYMRVAVQVLNSGLQAERTDFSQVFFGLQSILNHAANISKIIWGAPGKTPDKEWKNARTKKMQTLLSINESSQLHGRVMRNNLEHLDDRLDEWCLTPEARGNSVDHMIGPPNAIFIEGAPPQVFFRQFDPNTKIMRFFNDELNIHELVNEVERVEGAARASYRHLTGRDLY